MTDTRKIQLGVAVDATGAKEGFDQVKRDAQAMAQTVAQAGEKAGKSVGSIGSGGEESARKVDSATKSMIQSIQRTTALMEAGSKSSAKYYETLAAQRGVDVNALKPYLTQLDEVAAKQRRAEGAFRATAPAMQQVEMSSKQMAHALRQVPMQMTDVVTSLISGQAPMTVLVQQGGQLKDTFGGIGPAARAVAGYITGLVNPFTVAAAAVVGVAYAFHEGSKEAQAYSRALIMSGNAAGVTVSQLQGMAARIDAVAGTQRNAAAVLSSLAGSGRIAASELEALALAAIRMEEGLGIAVSETVKHFEDLAKSPAEASRKLNEQYRYLTSSVYEQIAALQAQGREEEAATLAQKTFADEFARRTEHVVDNLGLMERGWKALKKSAGEAIDEMLRIGRTATLAEQLADVRSEIQNYNPFAFSGDNIEILKARRDSILETMRLEQRAAESAAERNAIQQAAIGAVDAVSKANEKALTKQEQLNKALETYRGNIEKIRAADPSSALLDPNLIASAEKAIRESFTDKGAISKANAELEKQARLLAEGAGLSGDFAEKWDLLAKAHATGKLSMDELVQQQAKLLAQQPIIKKNMEAEARAAGVLAAELDDVAKARTTEVDRSYKATLASIKLVNDYGRSIAENNKLTEYEISLLGMTESQRNTAVEQYRIQLDLAREKLKLDELGLDAEEKRQRLAALDAAAAQAMDGAARRTWLNDWKKINDQVGQALTDALMQGGKSAGEYLRNYFKTLIFRPVIQAIMSPVSGLIATAFAPSVASAATGQAAGAMDWLSAGKTLWDGFNGGFASMGASAGNAVMNAGNFFGSSGMSSFGAGMSGGAPVSSMGWMSAEGGASYAGASAAQAGSLASAALPYIASTLAGYAISNAISGDYRVKHGDTLNLIGSLGGVIGGTISGVINRAFGMGPKQVKAFGIEGDFDAESFMGRNFADWKQKGGWFRSDKKGSDYAPLDAAVVDQFSANIMAIRAQTIGFAEALGLSADSIDGYSKSIKLELTKDEAENEKLIAELFGQIGNEMADIVGSFSDFARQGETASVTLQRLAVSLTGANAWLERLQQTAFQASVTGGDSASKLADAFGGLENLANASAAFYQAYYSEGERAARSREEMAKALEAIDMTLPATMAELRNAAQGLDLTTEAGRKAYVTLLSIAPEYANVAQATERLAKETAENLLAAFSIRGAIAPALSGTSALADEIYFLGQASADAVIDFAGLTDALANVDTATFTATIAQAFESLAGRISDVIGAIADERSAVREAALQIRNPGAMTPAEIQAALTGINTNLPTNSGLVGLDAQYAVVSQRAAAQAAALAAYQSSKGGLESLTGNYDASRLDRSQLVVMKDGVPTVNESLYGSNAAYKQAWDTALASHQKRFGTGYTGKSDGYVLEQGLLSMLAPAIEAEKTAYERALQEQSAKVDALKASYQAATEALNSAQSAAAQQAKAAQLAYADAMQDFAIEAGQSVNKLSRLREETLKYYEAQKQLAELMMNSAAGIRKTVADYRYSQLSPEDQFASLRQQFATAYSMSLVTQGDTLAGYADTINGLINPLLEKARDVYGDGADFNKIVAAVIAQANSVAGRLDSLVPTDYAADSLAVLEQIDLTLAALESATRTADQLIVGAINASRDQTVNGLRAVVAALTGQAIPAFATGGMHSGGLRLVGERGPELEVTGAARIFSAAQTRQLLAGGGNAEVVAELRALRQENADLRIAFEAVATHTNNTARRLERIEGEGLVVRTEDGETLMVKVVA